jgi:SnoaL-like domain
VGCMTGIDAVGAEAPVRFSVEYWAAFWADPDPGRIGRALAPDAEADWPGDGERVRGAEAYRARVRRVLDRVPDLRLEVAEHAVNGDVIFIRWVARGTGLGGKRFEMDGMDRILVEDGRVKENIIRYDSALFDALVGPIDG